MESRAIKIKSPNNSKISIKVIPGHFATNHSHINYYIDMTSIKHRHAMAYEAAATMARKYENNTCLLYTSLGVSNKYCGEHIRLIIPEFLQRHHGPGVPFAANRTDHSHGGPCRTELPDNRTGPAEMVCTLFTGRII